CGWLGFPLAKEFIKSGFEVKGSTTSTKKLSSLMANRIIPFQISLNPDVKGENLKSFFECDYLVINIPPQGKDNVEEFHLSQIKSVIEQLNKSHCRKIIFISSTSVYGNTNSEVNEEDPTKPETDSGKALVKVEEYLRAEQDFEVTIIRFGGLIGEDRNPAYYFAGRKNIPGGNSPVNLIHQTDCVGIIKTIVKNEIWNETINGVSPYHPTKKEFYTKAATKLKLDLPEFDEDKVPYKIVTSKKVQVLLNYNFIYPNPLMMV
ncbi:MAG TPA: NAD(P)H-binding protein, partial [Ignavibacteriaceae bacterium]|nr:NAD(P)H-binding protein [Ignavibacteriaceae bacterium]